RARARIAALESERDEALQREAAVAEVLQIISNSPDDLQAVLDAIVERVVHLLDSPGAGVRLLDGNSMQAVCTANDGRIVSDIRLTAPLVLEDFITAESIAGTAILENRTVVVSGGPEALRAQFPQVVRVHAAASARGLTLHGSAVVVPLCRNGLAFG